MRIFIHNADTYLGKILVKELRKVDDKLNRMFGTSLTGPENAPKAVKRLVGREDPKREKRMAETIQSCGLVILDLFSCSVEDLHFAIKALKVDPTSSPPKTTGELANDVVFVLISSVMVWAGTQPQAEDGFLSEAEYARRSPLSGTKYELWKELEDLVMNCFNQEGSRVKGFVVAGGVIYGEGEETLCPVFKDAWRGVQEHVILAPGTNRIPTVHVRDLSRLVRQVSFTATDVNPQEAPYYIAVDQPPCAEDEKPRPSTQEEIVHGIINEVCEDYEVPVISAVLNLDEPPDDLKEAMSLNLMISPSKLMLDPEFANQSDPPGMFCKEGLVHNVRKIASEFCRERKLQAMRVIVAGPPASGKTSLADAVSEHFRIPRLEAPQDLESMVETLSSTVCRYRGYVLDAGVMGFEEMDRLFRMDVEVQPDEDEEPPPPPADDDEEGEAAPAKKFERKLNEEVCPTYVAVTEAPEPLCRARWQARGTGTVEDFQKQMDEYKAANLSGEQSLTDFFQDVAKIGILNLPIAMKDQEDMFESMRIYMEKAGRPFNYLPTEEEVAEEILARRAEKEEAEEEKAAEEQRQTDDGAERERREAARMEERLRIIAQHQEEHQRLSELPLREYLMRYMVPTLTEGLIETCKVLPDNPVDYLATYLEEHAADQPSTN